MILATLLYELFGGALLAPRAVVYLYMPDASGLSQRVSRSGGWHRYRPGRRSRAFRIWPAGPHRKSDTVAAPRPAQNHSRSDSVTQISSDSLIGDKFVDITSGTNPGTIAPGGELIYKNQPELLRSLDLTQFTAQLRLVDATLSDIEQGRSQFGQFVEGDQFYKDLQNDWRNCKPRSSDAVSTTGMVGSLLNYGPACSARWAMSWCASIRQIAKVQSGQGPAGAATARQRPIRPVAQRRARVPPVGGDPGR